MRFVVFLLLALSVVASASPSPREISQDYQAQKALQAPQESTEVQKKGHPGLWKAGGCAGGLVFAHRRNKNKAHKGGKIKGLLRNGLYCGVGAGTGTVAYKFMHKNKKNNNKQQVHPTNPTDV